MKALALLCICIATYLWFPLPKQRALKIEPTHKGGKNQQQDLVARLEARPASASEVLQALEVIRLSVSSGITISNAIERTIGLCSVPVARELEQVISQFKLGFTLSHGLRGMAQRNPNWMSVSDTLITALDSGNPILDQLADVEIMMQSSIDTQKLKQIKSVAVKSVLPLGLCFLPAFVLLAVIPIVASLISGITQ